MTFELAAFKGLDWSKRWEDLRFPAQGINPPGGVNDADVEATTGMLLFDAGSIEIAMGVAQMPHSWDEGTEIRPHVHWTPTNTNTGSVLWQLDYQIANPGEAFNFTDGWTTLQVLDAASGVSGTHQIAAFGEIDMTGKRISCCIHWKLSRAADDETDTYNEDARLIEFDIHYQNDRSGGSVQEFTKQGTP
jgi:hypothetical protein